MRGARRTSFHLVRGAGNAPLIVFSRTPIRDGRAGPTAAMAPLGYGMMQEGRAAAQAAPACWPVACLPGVWAG